MPEDERQRVLDNVQIRYAWWDDRTAISPDLTLRTARLRLGGKVVGLFTYHPAALETVIAKSRPEHAARLASMALGAMELDLPELLATYAAAAADLRSLQSEDDQQLVALFEGAAPERRLTCIEVPGISLRLRTIAGGRDRRLAARAKRILDGLIGAAPRGRPPKEIQQRECWRDYQRYYVVYQRLQPAIERAQAVMQEDRAADVPAVLRDLDYNAAEINAVLDEQSARSMDAWIREAATTFVWHEATADVPDISRDAIRVSIGRGYDLHMRRNK